MFYVQLAMLKAAENLFYLSLLYCRCRRAADAAADDKDVAVIVGSVWLSGLFVSDNLLLATKMGGSVGSLVHLRLAENLQAAGWNSGGFQIALIAVFLTGLFWIFGEQVFWILIFQPLFNLHDLSTGICFLR